MPSSLYLMLSCLWSWSQSCLFLGYLLSSISLQHCSKVLSSCFTVHFNGKTFLFQLFLSYLSICFFPTTSIILLLGSYLLTGPHPSFTFGDLFSKFDAEISLFYILLFYAYGCFAWMYAYAPLVCLLPQRDQKRKSDLLELAFMLVMNRHVNARN